MNKWCVLVVLSDVALLDLAKGETNLRRFQPLRNKQVRNRMILHKGNECKILVMLIVIVAMDPVRGVC